MTTLKRYTGTAWETVVGVLPQISMSPQTLGVAIVTANQGSLTGETDLTGLTVTVTVPEGRRIRITGHVGIQNSSASARMITYIKEGATYLAEGAGFTSTGTGSLDGHDQPSVILTPSAGTHTYKLSMGVGTGTGTMPASATSPSYLLVEDITGSTLPYQSSSVPVGVLAYAEKTSNPFGAFSDATEMHRVNFVVPAGRQIRITAKTELAISNADVWVAGDIFVDGSTLGQGTLSSMAASQQDTLHVETVLSPSAGVHTATFSVRRVSGSGTITPAIGVNVPTFLMVEDITPTPAPANTAPSSTLGFAEQVSLTQAGITSEVDVTGLSVTVTVPAGRRIRITGRALAQNTAVPNQTIFRIQEDGTNVGVAALIHGSINTNEEIAVSAIRTPAAGTHTYKLRASAGGGSLTIIAASTGPAYILVEDITANSSLADTNREDMLPLGLAGTLVVGAGTARFTWPFGATILGVSASVGTAPTGASIILDVHKNGTTIFTTQGNRPEIAISGFYSGEETPDVTVVNAGDYFTVDRDQVGSTIAGADANLVIRYRRA